MTNFSKVSTASLVACLASVPAMADSNGVLGAVLNSETQVLGGPFDHSDSVGSPENSTATATFAGGFSATEVLIEGDITGVLAFNGSYFFGEGDIVITDPSAGTLTWQNPAGTVPDTSGPTPYSATSNFGSPVAVAGDWDFEFIDTFDDGAGADSISTDVSVTVREVAPSTDVNGLFSLGSLSPVGSVSSEGEFLLAGLVDTYSLTVGAAGDIDIVTSEDPGGISGGDPVDTELGLFDASGVMIAYNDDIGSPNFYSNILGESIPAGNYTIAIAGFGSNMSSGGVGSLLLGDVTGGDSTGDYLLDVTLVPEPASALLLGAGALMIARRRRA